MNGVGPPNEPTSASTLIPRPRFAVLIRRAFDRLREMFGRLRALHRQPATEDEAWHAVDAGVLGGIGVALHALFVVVGREAPAYLTGIEPALSRRLKSTLRDR
jgi:hypothetical protein